MGFLYTIVFLSKKNFPLEQHVTYFCLVNDAKVELFDVLFINCGRAGLVVQDSISENILVATRCEISMCKYGAVAQGSLTSATFNDCLFHENNIDGIHGSDHATIHLHGEATAIYANDEYGICARESGKVIIHLPSNHNTTYDNDFQDRLAINGGTITNVED